MNNYKVESVTKNNIKYFIVRNSESMEIVIEVSKYLKHKVSSHCSPNTVHKIACALSYYLDYLKALDLDVEQVLLMEYTDQHDHFVNFLYWIQAGNHKDNGKMPKNNTCNSYLQAVFGYYEFILLEYEKEGDIKVLEKRELSYSGTAGVRFRRHVNTFKGYLTKEESIGRTIKEDKIKILLDACTNIRNMLIILILAETGFRIGELLGIRYSKDIDYDNRTIRVQFREDNENEARAKNAEIRRAKISKETFDLLLIYISENRDLLKKTEYLFITLSGDTIGTPLTNKAVYSILNTLEKRTGIKVTPHMLRHYFANKRRKENWRIETISMALGHKQIATTMKYMNIEEDEMAVAMDKYYKEHQGLIDITKVI